MSFSRWPRTWCWIETSFSVILAGKGITMSTHSFPWYELTRSNPTLSVPLFSDHSDRGAQTGDSWHMAVAMVQSEKLTLFRKRVCLPTNWGGCLILFAIWCQVWRNPWNKDSCYRDFSGCVTLSLDGIYNEVIWTNWVGNTLPLSRLALYKLFRGDCIWWCWCWRR